MKLYFSIDLESWTYLDDPRFIDLDSGTKKRMDNSFILESINKILSILDKYNRKITFFCLGDIFTWYPDIIREIKRQGHELAYHTHVHKKITGSELIQRECIASREFLEEFKPVGFRAPEIYLTKDAIFPLIENGLLYSSSVYGNSIASIEYLGKTLFEFPVSSYVYRGNKIIEIKYPRSMNLSMITKEIPFGSGYLFAGLPMFAIEWFIRKYFEADKPVFMFVHNWQIVRPRDATYPDLWHKIIHPAYFPYNLNVWDKFEYLLNNYEFGKMEEYLWIQKNTGKNR